MKRNLLISIILLLSYCTVYGQLSTDEEPLSFRTNVPLLKRSAKAQKITASLDMKKIGQEDIADEENGLPPRFGYKHEVNYNLDNSGEWTELPDGSKMWRLSIACPGALSINLLYDKFWIPDSAKFFIYSNDRKHSIGAFTSVNNKGDRKDIQGFATGLVYGDQVTLEYWLPSDAKEVGVISVAYVIHGYKYILLSDDEMYAGYGQSGNCQVNVNCNEGRNWQNEKNAVAMILVDGDRWCTGSLVNTTANDNRPLFLTADHCLVGRDAIGNPNLNHWSFYWNYESPGCANASSGTRSTAGATVVANNGVTDFALLRLTENPRNATNITPYYLGWDRSGNAGTGGVGIHHPSGDIKKISTYSMTPINSYCANSNLYWDVRFIQTANGHSVMEPGSSGSPLINSNRKVIGQLYGPYNLSRCPAYQCNNPSLQQVAYGKLSVSWTGNGATDSRRRLRDWLDPAGTNPQTLNGMEKIPIPSIYGYSQEVCGSGTFTLINPPSGTIYWKVSNPSLFMVTPSGNPTTVYVIGTGTSIATLSAHTGSTSGPVITSIVIVPCTLKVASEPLVLAYPNPVNDILRIEIDRDALVQSETVEQTEAYISRINTNPTFDIRLFDRLGNLLRSTKTKDDTVEFNVANLPNGMYFLYVYDGESTKPEMLKIIVRH